MRTSFWCKHTTYYSSLSEYSLRPLEEEKMVMVGTQANSQRLLDLSNNNTESGGVPFYNRDNLIRQLRNSGVRV